MGAGGRRTSGGHVRLRDPLAAPARARYPHTQWSRTPRPLRQQLHQLRPVRCTGTARRCFALQRRRCRVGTQTRTAAGRTAVAAGHTAVDRTAADRIGPECDASSASVVLSAEVCRDRTPAGCKTADARASAHETFALSEQDRTRTSFRGRRGRNRASEAMVEMEEEDGVKVGDEVGLCPQDASSASALFGGRPTRDNS